MNLLSSPHPSILTGTLNPKSSKSPKSPSLNLTLTKFPFPSSSRSPPIPLYCTASSSSNDPTQSSRPPKPTPKPPRSPPTPPPKRNDEPTAFVDEWGEKTEPEPEPTTRFPDPIGDDDKWGAVQNELPLPNVGSGEEEEERLMDLKRGLLDTVYGTDSGFGASSDVRAEALELVQQLEAANPTPSPTQAAELLDGNWVLVYTAFSELLPLLAAGRIPSVKVEKICQRIDATNLTIENSTTLTGPVATFSFSALANFEVRSPCRIQVEFKESSFNPPEIKSTVDLPENINIFGQNISLSPVQQTLNPLQSALADIAGTVSSQSPLKIPIPGERTKSWLLITYLDKDLRISRGDSGLFVLVKEGSPLLYQ